MSRRRPSRWNGLLPVYKKTGPTSHDIVDIARRSLKERRIGHTGTLDPMAEGLLLLCVGRATRLHEQLDEGASFENLANEYSTDPNAGPGGDLGWLKAEDLPEFFRDVLAEMQPGDISQVLRESSGFRIVKLVEREDPRPYEFEEIRNELRQMYEQDKMEVIYKDYVEKLRGDFHIAIFRQ